MKKVFNKPISLIKRINLEHISYIILLLWAVSPVVEYFLKNYSYTSYTHYYVRSIYVIGTIGIFEYIMYIFQKFKNKSFVLKDFIPQILIMILLVLSEIATVYSKNPSLSFFGENYRKEGLLVYIMYCGFIMSASIIKEKKFIKNIIKTIIVSAIIITILPLLNEGFSYGNFSNIFHNSNHYGYFLMICSILSGFMFVKYAGFKRIMYLLIFCLISYMLIVNDTFGCYLAIFIGLIFALVYSVIKDYKPKEITALFTTFILLSFFISLTGIKIAEKVPSNDIHGIVFNNIASLFKDANSFLSSSDEVASNKAGSGRGRLWKKASEYILEHPITGGGMECLNEYYRQNLILMDRPHNMILQVAAFIGIPGAIIYLTLIVYLAIKNLKYLTKDTYNYMIYTTAMCYFISSMFGNSMYYTSPYFMILLGFLINMRTNNFTKQN